MTLPGRYSGAYANTSSARCSQFFKWYATEDPDEPRPNPVACLKLR
jgi:hypothetical protein